MNNRAKDRHRPPERIYTVTFDEQRGKFVAKDGSGFPLHADAVQGHAVLAAIRRADEAAKDYIRVTVLLERKNDWFKRIHVAEAVPIGVRRVASQDAIKQDGTP